jgi:bifunctional ADP-heptose synthase (sugar kinase/adenylyltransferase)
MGDVLVVTVTPDRFVNKGPHRPAFPEQVRAEAVAALSCVDLVAVNEWPTAVEPIGLLRPDVYVKGSEYSDADKDVTGGIARERAAVEAAGGRLAFTHELTSSSSNLLNRYTPILSDEAREFLADFDRRYHADDVLAYLDRMRDLKVLVVGETIIDEYHYCDSIGKSSKAAALVAKVADQERFAGGILAVANHLASLCSEVAVVSQLGDRSSHEEFVRAQLDPRVTPVFLTRKDSPTIVKRRFIESYFFTPMFELYEINDDALDPGDDDVLCSTLRERLPHYDLTVVVDYGHSMLTTAAVDVLCENSRLLAMNAQANAGNRGYHRLSKYGRADYVCAAEHEMYLEARDWRGDLRPVLRDVAERLHCPRVLVTRGNKGALCYDAGEGFTEVPALATKVVDRVGAGDAFLAVTAPMVALEAPMEMVGFVGNVAGAEAVATVGHRRYLDRERLSKHVQVLIT